VIDATTREINLGVADEVIEARQSAKPQPEPRYRRGLLAKYAHMVTSASEGAVTDKNL